jgi:hypothetical protein
VTPKAAATTPPSAAGKVAKAKPGSRPVDRKASPVARRGSGLGRTGRNSMLRNVYGYLKAYVPVFIAFAIIFAGVWVWTSWGPHTNTPKENWNQIENIWKPKRDADLKAVSTAVAANDFTATLNAYKAVRDDTNGWIDALGKITAWEDATASAPPGQAASASQYVSLVVQDGKAEVALLDQVAAAKSPNDILALKDSIDTADQSFGADYDSARQAIVGTAPAPSGEPTLALPSGSLSPSGSPAGSAAPGSSAAPSTAASPS